MRKLGWVPIINHITVVILSYAEGLLVESGKLYFVFIWVTFCSIFLCSGIVLAVVVVFQYVLPVVQFSQYDLPLLFSISSHVSSYLSCRYCSIKVLTFLLKFDVRFSSLFCVCIICIILFYV